MPGQYIYGIINCGEKINLTPKGFLGQAIHNRPYRNFSAVVSVMPALKLDVGRQEVFLHEEIIEILMQQLTVIPMRYGTVLAGEREVGLLLATYHDLIAATLLRLENKVEMGLKVIWPVEAIEMELLAGAEIQKIEAVLKCKAGGQQYLWKKRKDYWLERALLQKADQLAVEISALLQPFTQEIKIKKLLTRKMVLNFALLIDKADLARFEDSLAEIHSFYPGLKFLGSGPWPPYNFTRMTMKLNDLGEGAMKVGW